MELVAKLVGGDNYADNNLSFNMRDASNTFFVDEDDDFRLQSGGAGEFLVVKTGALSTYASSFTTDLDGEERTADGNTGWSMGAFEQND